ncbi:IPT/TIG domain-containing protein [Spirosoma knui]
MKSTLPLFITFLFLISLSGCRIQKSPPELTGLTPRQAFVDQPVTLNGYQFGKSPVVTFGSAGSAVTAKVASSDDNTIRVLVPLVPPGSTQVRVQTDEGLSDPLPFMVQQPAPAIAGINPGNGLPGTTVELTGAYLNQVKSIKFAGINATVKDSSAQKLTVVVPATVPRGSIGVNVETAGGVVSGSFIVAGTPQITSISPKQAKPGAELTIQGTNLLDAVVYINELGTDRTQTTIKDNEIRTMIPTNAKSGRVTVRVFEKLVAVSTDSVQIIQRPAIANLSSRDGVAGDKLILTGESLRDVTSVTFGATSVNFRVLSDTQIEATVPAFTTSGNVTISATSVGGVATAADPFFFYLAPSNISVNLARQLRGRPISITGQNLYRIQEVRIGAIAVPITDRVEGTQLLVNVPTNGVSGPVTVVNRAGSATTARPLVVVQNPVVTDIIPARARLGERVVLRGDFLLDAQIFFTGTNVPAVDAGKNEDTERWVLVPNDAQTGPLRIVNATNDGVLTTPFTVLRLPSGLDYTPKSAKIGEDIVITGQNLASIQAVRFSSGSSVPATFIVNGNSLIVTVPVGAATGQICLTNEAGTACTTSNFTVFK